MKYITPEWQHLNEAAHARNPEFGSNGDKWALQILRLAAAYNAKTILDYGCGKGSLAKKLRIMQPRLDVREYDPAIRSKSELPVPACFVVCTDVLEHIEPALLDSVLTHLAKLTKRVAFVTIATHLSGTIMNDGRNAHILMATPGQWYDELRKHFVILNWLDSGTNAFWTHRMIRPNNVRKRLGDEYSAVLAPLK